MMNTRYFLTLAAVLFITVAPVQAQDAPQGPDSLKVLIGNQGALDSLNSDEKKVIEDGTLDIAQNRGLFIISPDADMQLRILGSVRYLMVFDDHDLVFKNQLNTYEILTGDDNKTLANYFNGLSQSRLGFEVTRQTRGGNVFIRLETDFAGVNGYRIRHAYGQYRNFILGQTWSLFTHITTLISTVGFGGPTGAVSLRTPQIRYTTKNLLEGYTLSFGLEYFKPQIDQLDSLDIKSFQIIPDLTARIEKRTDWGVVQISGLMTLLSGGLETGEVRVRPGWGVAFSANVDSWANGKWYIQAAGGQGTSRYLNDLNGQGLDVIFLPDNDEIYLPFSFGGHIGYEHYWTSNIYSNFIFSALYLEGKSGVPDNLYNWGGSFQTNSFWNVTDGARVGLEYIRGLRMDQNGDRGAVNRINILVFYDF